MTDVPNRPKWCPPGTVLTTRGWVSSSGELLAAKKIPKDIVTEWKKQHGLQRASVGEKRPEAAEEEEYQKRLEEARLALLKEVEEKKPAKKRTRKTTKKKTSPAQESDNPIVEDEKLSPEVDIESMKQDDEVI